MRFFLFVIGGLFILSACSIEVNRDVEDQLYTCLKGKYKQKGVNLEKELNRLENHLIKYKILENASGEAKIKYYKQIIKEGQIPPLQNIRVLKQLMKVPFSASILSSCQKRAGKKDSAAFAKSRFYKINQNIQMNIAAHGGAFSTGTVAKAMIKELTAEDFEHPYYRALMLLLVVQTADRNTTYMRQIPKKLPPLQVSPISEKNIFAIVANAKNQIMVRGEILNDPDQISEKIIEYYTKNRDLSKSEMQLVASTASHPGFNFPLYSKLTSEDIENYLAEAKIQLETTKKEHSSDVDLVNHKTEIVDQWIKKRRSLKLYGKKTMPEIHIQAHIRIEVQKETEYALFAKIQSEIEEAYFYLRNEEALKIFKTPYGIIKRRDALNKNPNNKDRLKLDLLDTLYPKRVIEVKPK